MKPLPLIEKRRIQAEVLVPLIRALQTIFGEEEVNRVVANSIAEMARNQGRQIAGRSSGSPLESLKGLLAGFRAGGALEIELIEETDSTLCFNVTRCAYAEHYAAMGATDLGLILSCSRDHGLAEGLSERLRLTRRQTIMEGAAICDFCFSLDG